MSGIYYYVVKVIVSAALIVAISELSKRSTFVGALLASIPIVSVLAMIWLYVDTRDAGQVAALSRSVFWLVLPSLVLFVLLPPLLERGYSFYGSLAVSMGATAAKLVLTSRRAEYVRYAATASAIMMHVTAITTTTSITAIPPARAGAGNAHIERGPESQRPLTS